MFCQNCGSELEIENQRYCQECGSEILYVSQRSQTPIRMTQNTAINSSIPIPQYTTFVKKGGPASSQSNISFGFGLVSLIIGLITLYIGLNIRGITYFYTPRPMFLVGLNVARVIGIIFAIISIISSGIAKGMESDNALLNKGIVMGIIGLAINALLILIAISSI
ncbi:MAG: hypothetical protein ACFFA0_08885 [Promethearchaeota archaeon]